jgi:hypothetical protein
MTIVRSISPEARIGDGLCVWATSKLGIDYAIAITGWRWPSLGCMGKHCSAGKQERCHPTHCLSQPMYKIKGAKVRCFIAELESSSAARRAVSLLREKVVVEAREKKEYIAIWHGPSAVLRRPRDVSVLSTVAQKRSSPAPPRNMYPDPVRYQSHTARGQAHQLLAVM